AALMAAATSSALPTSRSVTRTRQPSRPNVSQIARPIPRPPPVTIALLPASLMRPPPAVYGGIIAQAPRTAGSRAALARVDTAAIIAAQRTWRPGWRDGGRHGRETDPVGRRGGERADEPELIEVEPSA